MSFSAHKTYGPKGVGALFVRRKPRVRIEAQMHGGGHERGMRSGTLPTHQIVGMGEAFRLARLEMDADNERIRHVARPALGGLVGDRGGLPERRHGAARAAQPERQLQFRRRREPDHGDQGRRGVVGLGVHVGVARAFVCAAGARPQRRACAQLDSLHRRPLHDGRGDRRTRSTWCSERSRSFASCRRCGKCTRKASTSARSNGRRIDRFRPKFRDLRSHDTLGEQVFHEKLGTALRFSCRTELQANPSAGSRRLRRLYGIQ